MKRIRDIRRNFEPHWVGDGFPVRSLFSYHDDAELHDPFLLLDYAEPYQFPPATSPRGVGEHPHRGFETVTIVYQGELEHHDSAGNRGTIGPGDVQWMTAAAGVVHAEYHSEKFTRSGGFFEVAQLWVNLPANHKMSRPRYQEIHAAAIPHAELPNSGGTARVIAGEFAGVRGPAATVTPVMVSDLELAEGHATEIKLQNGYTAILIVQRGSLVLNDSEPVKGIEVVEFGRDGERIFVECRQQARALLLSGQPIGEPIVGQGPFVMNTREEIGQAIGDFQSGRMGSLA